MSILTTPTKTYVLRSARSRPIAALTDRNDVDRFKSSLGIRFRMDGLVAPERIHPSRPTPTPSDRSRMDITSNLDRSRDANIGTYVYVCRNC